MKNRSTGSFSRRDILKLSPIVLLTACDVAPEGGAETVLHSVQQFNDWVQAKVFDPEKLAPEYHDSDLTPEEGFRVNGKDDEYPEIDPEGWTLTVGGLVEKPGEYTLQQITAMPKRVMNTRHCCVEGWSMIPKWGGTPLRDFLRTVGVNEKAKYLLAECEDEYFTSYDMPSAMHAQTLLCYEAYNKPLTVPHGAPLRIVMPTKLGYKSAKWISKITVTDQKPGGYWEDQGYDWFAGI